MDDAGVYRVSDDLALVQTLDFFPPVVDDPFQYGRIGAANSLSDVYAMGGRPLTALQIVGFPKDEAPLELLREILKGGADALAEASCNMLGGHSVVDQEIKYGLSVTGAVHPDRIFRNAGALPGDHLYLTKPIGMGVITTAAKKRKVDDETIAAACAVMGTLNAGAAEAARAVEGIHAVTDVTGFGLLGHAAEMAKGSDVTLIFEAREVPFFQTALDLAEKNLLSGGSARTRDFLAGQFEFADSVPVVQQDVMFDAETSGGLLIAVAPEHATDLENELHQRNVPVHRVGTAESNQSVWIKAR